MRGGAFPTMFSVPSQRAAAGVGPKDGVNCHSSALGQRVAQSYVLPEMGLALSPSSSMGDSVIWIPRNAPCWVALPCC